MKKLTPILTIYHTANFLDEGNPAGKEIDFGNAPLLRLAPVPSLADRIQALGGQVVSTNHFTRLFLPFDFGQAPPATSVSHLPAQLLFYIIAVDKEKVRFSGIHLNGQVLFVKPGAGPASYVFNKKTIACKPCGAAAVLAAGDGVPTMPAGISLSGIQSLIQQPLGNANQPLDLKVTIDATVVPVVKDEDLRTVRQALHEAKYKTAAVAFNRQSDNSALKSFPKILVTPNSLPPGTIGLVSIPVAGLTVNDTNPARYIDLNNYIVHFPGFQATISLTINTTQFDGTSKLQLDGVDVPGASAIDHPQMPTYKKVTGTVNNYKLYANKGKLVTIVNGNKKKNMPIDPMNTYNPATNTATITITK